MKITNLINCLNSGISIAAGPCAGLPSAISHLTLATFDAMKMAQYKNDNIKSSYWKTKAQHNLKWAGLSLLQSIYLVGGLIAIFLQRKSTHEIETAPLAINEEATIEIQSRLVLESGLNPSDIDLIVRQALKHFSKENAKSMASSYFGGDKERIVLYDVRPTRRRVLISNELIGEGGSKKVYSGISFDLKGNIEEKALIVSSTESIDEEKKRIKDLKLPQVAKLGKFVCQQGETRYYIGPLYDHDASFPHDIYNTVLIFLGAARSLADLHAKGYFHGDVKPYNIFVKYKEGTESEVEFAALGDLGCCRKEHRFISYTEGGTLCYLAPESKNGYNRKGDMWAFGISLYEKLYKSLPPFILEIEHTAQNEHHFKKALSKLQQNTVNEALEKDPKINIHPHAKRLFKQLISDLLQVDPKKRLQPEDVISRLEQIQKEIKRK